MSWKLIEKTYYYEVYKNDSDRYIYINSQVDNSVVVRFGVWKNKSIKTPSGKHNVPKLEGKKEFKTWKSAEKFINEYMNEYR